MEKGFVWSPLLPTPGVSVRKAGKVTTALFPLVTVSVEPITPRSKDQLGEPHKRFARLMPPA